MPQVEADGREEQRERNRESDNQRAANVAEEEKEDDHHQDDSLGQVMQHGVRREVDEIVTIEERHDLHTRRQQALLACDGRLSGLIERKLLW